MALRTERFILEPLSLEHAEVLYQMRSFPEIYKWTSTGRWNSLDVSVDYIKDKIENTSPKLRNYVVTITDSSESPIAKEELPQTPQGNYAVASIGIIRPAEIGYIVHPKAWGFGVAKESVRAMIKAYFQDFPDEEQLKAYIDVNNIASLGVLKRMGFVDDGRGEYTSPEMGKVVLVTWIVKRETVAQW